MKIRGIGTDIIEVDRIKNAIEKWGETFLNRIFCDEEMAYAKLHENPYPYYAARFAAKEAIFKAFGDKPYLEWKSIRILKDDNGKPFCQYDNSDFNGEIMISLSHTHNYAVASAIITEN